MVCPKSSPRHCLDDDDLVEQIEGREIKSGWIVDEMNTEKWTGEL
jgi:hypothetical protein